MKMKADGRNRRKVVVRRLPPSLSPLQFFDQADRLFSDRYNWACYRPGTTSSRKYQRCSRAYIEFKVPEDVLHFAELFDGHIFINEKGVQYKATVEYAPSKSVPKPSVKDGRDGTIFIDPEYLEFLKLIAEPFENQRSVGNQLKIKETDQTDEFPVVTSLMEFVRKRRTADSGTQSINGYWKVDRRATRGKPHSTFKKNDPNKEKNMPREKSQSTNKNNLEKNHAKSNLGEKKSLFCNTKEMKMFEASSLSSGVVPCNRKVDLEILQNSNRVHEPNNTSNPSLACDATASQGEAKKIPYGRRKKGATNRLDNKVKEPQLYPHRSGDAPSPPSHTQTDRVPRQGMNDRKPSKRGTLNRRGAHEKQVWVQKSPSSAGK